MEKCDAIVVGAGLAGLSAAIYLGRAQRRVLVVSSGRSMAVWEADVENYLGFPEGISGEDLIERGRSQAEAYGAVFVDDQVEGVTPTDSSFTLASKTQTYGARKVLLATGIFHLPPEINGVKECLGHSMFFCKDCDGCRVKGQRIAIFGNNDEAVEYALGMMHYSPRVLLVLHGKKASWSAQHDEWVHEYSIPIYAEKILEVAHDGCELRALLFENGDRVALDALFTTRGDIFHNSLAKSAGAEIDESGEIVTDACLQTSVPGLYAAGCVTAANCQMIIAAGQGAIAGQAINRALFEEELRNHALRRHRDHQIQHERTEPHVIAREAR